MHITVHFESTDSTYRQHKLFQISCQSEYCVVAQSFSVLNQLALLGVGFEEPVQSEHDSILYMLEREHISKYS